MLSVQQLVFTALPCPMNKKANIVLNDVTSSVRPMMERFQNNPEYPDDMFLKGAKAAELVDAGPCW